MGKADGLKWAKDNKDTRKFLEEIVGVCQKHGLSLSHEDGQGAFEVTEYQDRYAEWLMDAIDETGS